MAKVSIVVPVYNVEKYIERCLISCANQTLKDIEIICVNDGSPDNSQLIIDKFTSKDPRFKSITIKNSGLFEARMVGAREAVGEYIFFLDSDDYIPETAINELWKKAVKDQSDIVRGRFMKTFDDGTQTDMENEKFDIIGSHKFISILLNESFYMWVHLFEKSFFFKEEIKMPRRMDYSEDMVAMIQLAFNANKISFCDHIIYCYYQNPHSSTHSMTIKQHEDSLIALRYAKNMILASDIESESKSKIIALNLISLYNTIRWWNCLHITKEDYSLLKISFNKNKVIKNYIDAFYKTKKEKFILNILSLNYTFFSNIIKVINWFRNKKNN